MTAAAADDDDPDLDIWEVWNHPFMAITPRSTLT